MRRSRLTRRWFYHTGAKKYLPTDFSNKEVVIYNSPFTVAKKRYNDWQAVLHDKTSPDEYRWKDELIAASDKKREVKKRVLKYLNEHYPEPKENPIIKHTSSSANYDSSLNKKFKTLKDFGI